MRTGRMLFNDQEKCFVIINEKGKSQELTINFRIIYTHQQQELFHEAGHLEWPKCKAEV